MACQRAGPRAAGNEQGAQAAEVAEAVARGDDAATRDEVGDLLFAVVNVARHLGVDAESALRAAAGKFQSVATAKPATSACDNGNLTIKTDIGHEKPPRYLLN